MSYPVGNSVAMNGTTFALTTTSGERPSAPPKGLIATDAVQTKAGWVGQVFVDKSIVYESPTPFGSSDAAITDANKKVVGTITKLFETG